MPRQMAENWGRLGKWGTSHHLSFPTTVNLFVALLLLVASFLVAFFGIEIYEVSCCTKGWVWSRHWIADVLIPNNSSGSSSGGWRKSTSSGSSSNISSKLVAEVKLVVVEAFAVVIEVELVAKEVVVEVESSWSADTDDQPARTDKHYNDCLRPNLLAAP